MNLPSVCLLSSTLQPGIGPSDANRLLAAEFQRIGSKVSVCSLHENALERIEEHALASPGGEITALRIPSSVLWNEKERVVGDFLRTQDPDWLIFRFIPYSFHRKGIISAAARSFPAMFRGRKMVLLMDEVWIGLGNTPLRHKLVGLIQRFFILRMLRRLSPTLVFTNNLFNTRALGRAGVEAPMLRLFGSIPIVPADGGEWLLRELRQRGVAIDSSNRQEWLLFGNFGMCHPPWEPDGLFSSLKELAAKCGKKIGMLSIGSLGSTEGHWKSIASRYANDFSFAAFGMQDAGSVSLFFQSLDCGLTTNNYHHLGKSGTSMAMLEHGLSVIVTRILTGDDLSEFEGLPVIRYPSETFSEDMRNLRKSSQYCGVARCVQELLKRMDRCRE